MRVDIHASTVRRLLPALGVMWNRARPTLCIRDPTKAQKMRAINRALDKTDVDRPVFYVDEADVDFNPCIGFGWMKKGEQTGSNGTPRTPNFSYGFWPNCAGAIVEPDH